MQFIIVGLFPSKSLNVFLFDVCIMQNAYYSMPNHHNQITA